MRSQLHQAYRCQLIVIQVFFGTVRFNTYFLYILYIIFVFRDLLSVAVGPIVGIELGAFIYNILSNKELHKHAPKTVRKRTLRS